MRIAIDAHVVGRRATGNETYVVNLVDALMARSDVEPVVLVDAEVRWPGTSQPALHCLRARTPFGRIPIELPLAARRLRADLLHVQYVAPPLPGLPVVTAIHDVSFEDVPGLFGRATELRLKAFVRWTARRSTMVVTISEFTKSRIVHHYGLDPDRIVVTPLAVADRWRALAADDALRVVAPLGIGGPFVLAVGNVHPRKNLARLVRAVAALRSGGLAGLQLVIAGQRGWRATEVDAAVAAVGGSDWVRFTDYVDDETLRSLYSLAHVVAYLSLYEGFGLPVLEALACGAVVIASSTTAIPEVAGNAAILVDPASDEAVIEALRVAVTDDGLRARLHGAGPAHAATFTWDRSAELTVGAYRAALARSRS